MTRCTYRHHKTNAQCRHTSLDGTDRCYHHNQAKLDETKAKELLISRKRNWGPKFYEALSKINHPIIKEFHNATYT